MDAVDVPGLERNHVYRRNQQNGAWEVSGDYTPGLPNTLEDHLSLDVASADSPIVISEASSQNRTYARSADGECYDYIELYNTSAQSVSLAGYTLTDDPNDLAKYTFPEGTTIPAGGYCIVYALSLIHILYRFTGVSMKGSISENSMISFIFLSISARRMP